MTCLDTAIVVVSAEPLDLPLREPFAIASGSVAIARNVLIRIELASGIVGLGESAPYPQVDGDTQASVLVCVDKIRSVITGSDAARWRQVSQQLSEKDNLSPAALCGLEMAMLDALTRHYGMPLWKFFGGQQTELRTDMTVTAGDAKQAVVAARNIRQHGISTIKVKIGALTPVEDAERVVAIRQTVPDAGLLVDANGGYSVSAAIEFLEHMRNAGIRLEAFEQPVSRDDWSGMGEIRHVSDVPVFADESARHADDVVRIARQGLADGINIKVMKSGVVGALRMWELARAHGLNLMIGGMVESVLAMSFSASLAAGLGGFQLVDLDTPMFIKAHPFIGGFAQHGAILKLDNISGGHGVRLA